MKHNLVLIFLLIIAFCLGGMAQVKKEPIQTAKFVDTYLIEKDKPSVYVTFEKSGNAKPLFKDESNTRYWLRLRNNTRTSINFCSFEVDRVYGDTAVLYDIKENTNFGSKGTVEIKLPEIIETIPRRDNQKNNEIPSSGYVPGDSCLSFNLLSGKSVLFSIPKEHLIDEARTFKISIRFNFDWEKEGTEFGSQPEHFVSFNYGNLPFSERKNSPND